MKRDISLWQFGGFVFTSLLGTFLHFLYGLTSKSVLVAPFSAVNESTWEHMKLMYFPMLIFALVQSRYFKDFQSFWCAKLIGIATALFLVPALFYTARGAFGTSPDLVNIAIFFVSAAAAYLLETHLLKNDAPACKFPPLAIAAICLIGALFLVFTFFPPRLPLFRDAVTSAYGIWRQR